jgi:hypothetical protein
VRAGAPATAGRTSPRAWRAPAAVGLAVVTATAVLAVRSPYGSGSYGVCPLLAVTGLWCPFCGGLRAVHELTQADLAGAWAMNPLVVLGVPVLVLAWGAWLLAALGRQVPRSTAASWPAWALLGVAVVFGVARNVPALAPWLAPV